MEIYYFFVICLFCILFVKYYMLLKHLIQSRDKNTYLLYLGLCILFNAVFDLAVHRFIFKYFDILFTFKALLFRIVSFQQMQWVYLYAVIVTFTAVLSTILIQALRKRTYSLRLFLNLCFSRHMLFCYSAAFIYLLIGILCVFSNNIFLKINEVNVSNNMLYENGVYKPYIEIINTGYLQNTVFDVYIANAPNSENRQAIEWIELSPNDIMMLQLDTDIIDVSTEMTELYLLDSLGTVLDSVKFYIKEKDKVYCRTADGGGLWREDYPTPGITNTDAHGHIEAALKFSKESGFYDKPFYLDIESDVDLDIYYTIDGSRPTRNSICYQKPIYVYDRSGEENVINSKGNVTPDYKSKCITSELVDKGVVIRAVGYDKHGNRTSIADGTYFIDKKEYENENVLSIIVEPEELIGDDGIYVTGRTYDFYYENKKPVNEYSTNYYKKGRNNELISNITFMNNKAAVSQKAGLRIKGCGSRNNRYKSFTITSRKEYSGNHYFNYDIFNGLQTHRFIIRPGYSNSIVHLLVEDMNIATVNSQMAYVFINGEFYQKVNIVEEFDNQYFSNHYSIPKNNLIVFKAGQLDEGLETDQLEYEYLYSFIREHDLSEDSNYEEFLKIVDVDSYIKHMAIRTYIDDVDFNEKINYMIWKSRTVTDNPYEDGRWRWALYDMDAMENAWNAAEYYNVARQCEKNTFTLIPRYANHIPRNQLELYVALKQNKQFQQQYVNTFMDLCNTTFQYKNVQRVFEEYGEIDNELQKNVEEPLTQEYYEEFFCERQNYIIPYMAEEFELTGDLVNLNLSVNDSAAGDIKLNSVVPEFVDNQWSGRYFTDYPVTLTACEKEGYEFAGWSGDIQSSEETITVDLQKGGTDIHAVFKKK